LTHKERFRATAERKPVDRPATWLGLPAPDALPGLCKFFSVSDLDGLRDAVGDDIYPVEMPCNFPGGKPIYAALPFAKKNQSGPERSLTAPGFFEDYDDPSKIDDFDWPDPTLYIKEAECRKAIESAPGDRAVMGVLWSAHFQDACSAFGMEAALIKLYEAPDMFRAVIDRITEFYLTANKIFYEGTKGRLDAVLIGNDFGSQTGLMVSAGMLREFVLPGTKKLIDQAKGYGVKVMHHACGAISEIIPDLIEAGADIIHPMQALAAGMEPLTLRKKFGDAVSFCGGVDAQRLLVGGSPNEIAEKVRELKNIFPSGLIISPSHEAILPDVAPENVKALFDAARG